MVCSENVEVGVDNAHYERTTKKTTNSQYFVYELVVFYPIYRISLFIDWKSSAEIDASNFDL